MRYSRLREDGEDSESLTKYEDGETDSLELYEQNNTKGRLATLVRVHFWCIVLQIVLLGVYAVSAGVFAKSWRAYCSTSSKYCLSLKE